jgi:hypothetical protein
MKSIAISALFTAFIMSSCVKERTCECTRTDKLAGNAETAETYTFRSKKKDAKTACDKYSEDSYAEKVTCTLK